MRTVLERQRRIDFRYVILVRANWEAAKYCLAANKSHRIRSVHRPAYLLIPAVLVVLEAISDTGVSIGTTLIAFLVDYVSSSNR